MAPVDDTCNELPAQGSGNSLWWSNIRWGTVLKAFIMAGIGVGAVLVLIFFNLEEKLPAFLEWVEENKLLGSLYFVGLFTLWTVLCLPTLILNMGAGIVLQPLWFAVVVCWVGCVTGQTVSFLIGRYLFRDYVYEHAGQYKLWRALERSMEKEGWRITFLLRLCILLPFDVLNYILGASPVSLMDYSTASAVGIVPGLLFFCLLGKYVEDFSGIESGSSEDEAITTATVAVSLVSGVVLFLILGVLTYYTKLALDQIVKEDALKQAAEEAGGPTEPPGSSGGAEKGAAEPRGAARGGIAAKKGDEKADNSV